MKTKLFKASLALTCSIAMMSSIAETTGYYGDPTFNRVVAVNVDNMSFDGDVSVGNVPYPVDRAGKLDKIYAITRGDSSVDIVNPETLENIGKIVLDHTPRSGEAYNDKLGLVLMAGGNKAMSSLIDPKTDIVVATAGEDILTTPYDYGGSLSSGHPFWFSARKFAVIDRANRKIHMYKVKGNSNNGYETVKLDTINTPTSVHHILKAGKKFYAVMEGAPNDLIYPGLLELKVIGKHLIKQRKVFLDFEDVAVMGSHHADLHPNGKHIYIGSTEGNMYVVNRHEMVVSDVISTGAGCGHTRFVPSKDLAITTNHKDTFVSVIDSRTHEKIKDVTVSGEQMYGQILQSHTNHVDEDGDHYYAFASDNGIFYELSLDDLEINRSVSTGGTPRQGVFISN